MNNKFDERYAKSIIEKFFPQYGIFDIEDKPDLQRENIGIEVTQIVDKNSKSLQNDFRKLRNENISIDKKKKIYKKILNKGGKSFFGVMMLYPKEKSFKELLIERFHDKLQKLNLEYKLFTTNAIFLINDSHGSFDNDKDMLDTIFSIAQSFNSKVSFDKVFYYSSFVVYEIDLKSNSMKKFTMKYDDIVDVLNKCN